MLPVTLSPSSRHLARVVIYDFFQVQRTRHQLQGSNAATWLKVLSVKHEKTTPHHRMLARHSPGWHEPFFRRASQPKPSSVTDTGWIYLRTITSVVGDPNLNLGGLGRPKSKHLTTLHLHLFMLCMVCSRHESCLLLNQLDAFPNSHLSSLIWNIRGSWHLFCIHVPCLQREARKKREEGYAEPQMCQVQLSIKTESVVAYLPGNLETTSKGKGQHLES